MLYSPQMGLRVSICEFLKDLISNDRDPIIVSATQERPIEQKRQTQFPEVLLNQVVGRLVQFIEMEPI